MIELWIFKISILIIFFNLFMASIRSLFNLKKSNSLYCGIYGLSLKPKGNRALALANFKILGLYNIERGKDSCGVYIDGNIKKSILEFDDFIRDNYLGNTFKGSVLLGHNRAGSAGYKKTIEEAHPFLINDNLVFTHNGTIKNTAELCKKYSVVEKDFNVDSKLLGTLLYTEGNEVLENYKGFAALAYTKLDEKNTLYLYHGSSKNYKAGITVEERPLYFLETKDALYYSSLENSLKAIKSSEEDRVLNLNYNRIFKIVNGEFLLDETIEIKREEANIDNYTYTGHNYNRYNHYTHDYTGMGVSNYLPQFRAVRPTSSGVRNNMLPSVVQDKKKAYRESYPLRVIESSTTDFKYYGSDFIFYRCGRYWFPPSQKNSDPQLVEGSHLVKKGGLITQDSWDKAAELLYFFRGVLLKDMEAYKVLKGLSEIPKMHENWVNTPKKHNFGSEISKFSVYPVTTLPEELNEEISEYFRYSWYKEDTKKNNHSFTPKYSGRSYIIKDGILTDIKTSHSGKETCYFNSIAEVEDQLKRLKNGTQGGSSALILPFQPEEIKENMEEPFWPFDITFESIDELLKFWTNREHEALKEFIRKTYKRDFYISASETDVTTTLEHIINSSIKQSLSINEFIDKDFENDSKILRSIYDDMKEKEGKPEIESKTDTVLFKKQVMDIDNEEEKQVRDEKVFDQIESCIISLQDIQLNSFELQIEEDSDLAQDVVKVLLIGIENILSNLSEPLKKHNCKLLLEKVYQVKESKNVKDGIL